MNEWTRKKICSNAIDRDEKQVFIETKTSKKWEKKRVKYVHPIGIIKGLTRTPLNDISTAITYLVDSTI